MKCERGGCMGRTNGYDIFDYCHICSKNLCPFHMSEGCCGITPAVSGDRADTSIVMDLSEEETMETKKEIVESIREMYVNHSLPAKRSSGF